MTNIRAINQLVAAQLSLALKAPTQEPCLGIDFAEGLISHLDTDKPGVVTMGEMAFDFECSDVNVIGTNVHFGSFEISLDQIIAHDVGPFGVNMLVDEVNLLAETVPVALRAA